MKLNPMTYLGAIILASVVMTTVRSNVIQPKCYYGDKWYNVGDTVPVPQYPCYICTCREENHLIHCISKCEYDECDGRWVDPKEGECCSTCEHTSGCNYNGTDYGIGDTVPDVDRCFRCTCTNNNGQLDCVSICEYDECDGRWVDPKEGECCSTCEHTSGCNYNGTDYGIGDTVPDVDRCFRCTCTNNNGQLDCVSICEYGDCYGKWVKPKGDECCDTCEPTSGCSYNGKEYGIGDTVPDVDRCFRCTCTNNNGQLDCVSICEYGDCHGKWVKPKGDECCDTCEPTSGCSYNGKEYGIGDTVPDVDRCFRCTCTNNNGQLNCVSICEYGDCYGKWVEPKGDECCDTCEPIPGCMYNGTEYGIGQEVAHDNPCWTKCTCTDGGIVSCQKVSCPVLSCPEDMQEYIGDACCPTCMTRK